MSHAMQSEFEGLVLREYRRHSNHLKLNAPAFERDGFVSRASMAGPAGVVELVCGPADYHAEIFLNTTSDNKRWRLADLVGIEPIRNWMFQNRPSLSNKSTIDAEVCYAFDLLAHGLRAEPRFSWLYRGL